MIRYKESRITSHLLAMNSATLNRTSERSQQKGGQKLLFFEQLVMDLWPERGSAMLVEELCSQSNFFLHACLAMIAQWGQKLFRKQNLKFCELLITQRNVFYWLSLKHIERVCCLLLPKANYSPNFVFPAQILMWRLGGTKELNYYKPLIGSHLGYSHSQ